MNNRKILGLISIGAALESYDFSLYGVLAVYIADYFFPANQTPMMTLIQAYTIFAIAYLLRPLFSILIGHYGDKFGRKNIFIVMMIIMVVSTIGIVIVPSYSSIGITSMILLFIFRVGQSISLTGEMPVTAVYLAEILPPENRGRYLGIAFGISGLGFTFGSIITFITATIFSKDIMHMWAWKIPYILAIFIAVIAYYIRKNIKETSLFNESQQIKKIQLPIVTVIKNHKQSVFIGISIIAMNAAIMFLFTSLPSYIYKSNKALTTFDLSFYIFLYFTLFALFTIIFALIADRFSRKVLIASSNCLAIFFGIVFIVFFNTMPSLIIWLSIFAIINGLSNSVYATIVTELFPTEIRLTGYSLCFNLSYAIFGGITPLLLGSLISLNGGVTNAGYLIVLVAIISLVGSITFENKQGQKLS